MLTEKGANRSGCRGGQKLGWFCGLLSWITQNSIAHTRVSQTQSYDSYTKPLGCRYVGNLQNSLAFHFILETCPYGGSTLRPFYLHITYVCFECWTCNIYHTFTLQWFYYLWQEVLLNCFKLDQITIIWCWFRIYIMACMASIHRIQSGVLMPSQVL